MAAKSSNRFKVFNQDGDTNVLKPVSTSNAASGPFLNQVADDPSPWQEVRKRGVPAAQPSGIENMKPHPNQTDPKPWSTTRGRISQDQADAKPWRTIQGSTASVAMVSNGEKVQSLYENWCGVCSIRFSNKASLLSHIKMTPEHNNYCNLCRRVFKDRNGLKNHVDNSLGHEAFCNLCLSAFNDEWGLKNHLENNYAVGHEFVCLMCLLGFHTYDQLERHLRTAEKHVCCTSCRLRFPNQDERDKHWNITNKHKHCLEPGCNFDGPDQATLDHHLMYDHFQCEGCQRIYPSQTKLNQHAATCKFAITCTQCSLPCAGQQELTKHLEHCHYCAECNYQTHHDGNYKIHMTKHAAATLPCWGCAEPMRTYSSLINHLESSRCPNLPEPSLMMLCLGKWWYSVLYMDISIHAQLRTGRASPKEVHQWMQDGVLQPFICRAEGCQKTFGHLSSLILHCESHACGWDVPRLNMPGLEEEVRMFCVRRDSGVGLEY